MIRDMTDDATGASSGRQRAVRRIAEPRVHLNAFRGVPDVLARFNVPSEPILQAAHLTRLDLENPDRSASFADIDRLIGVCVRRTACPHFGLLLGQYVSLMSFGIAGRLARYAPLVGAALRDLAAHFVLHDSGGGPSLAIHDDTVTLAYGIHTAGVRNADQVYDLSAVSMVNVMRGLCGASWMPDAILLPRKRPKDIRPYREILGVPPRFDSVQCAVTFPTFWMTRPVADADPLLHTVLTNRASADLSGRHPTLRGDVCRTIRELLVTGECSRGAVARQLGLHERTLGRRLQVADTTFQQLLDETRVEIARQLLNDTSLPVSRIAMALGYGDPTVFTRAFTRWTGCNPSKYRADHLDRDPLALRPDSSTSRPQ